MKKLLSLLLISLLGCGQTTINHPSEISHPQKNTIKIGNLEIGDSLALEYLSDCYINADRHLVFILSNEMMTKSSYPTDYSNNDSIIDASIYHTIEKDTLNEETVFTYIYYYTVRTPSDVDFVKWIHSLKK